MDEDIYRIQPSYTGKGASAMICLSGKGDFNCRPFYIICEGVKFFVVYTGEHALHSSRPLYRVSCDTCMEVLHTGTTSYKHYVEQHIKQKHG